VSAACVRCGAPADGRLRVALWEEEEKGRLGAHHVVLCPSCHAAFLAGTLSRVEIARAYHAAKGVEPHGWIGRIDRDLLLDIVCLECGVILPVAPDDGAPGATPPADVRCRDCGTVNRFARRGEHWLTAEIVR
jgi:hypothetical protein